MIKDKILGKMYGVSEVSGITGLSRWRIYKLLRTGKISRQYWRHHRFFNGRYGYMIGDEGVEKIIKSDTLGTIKKKGGYNGFES